MTYFSIMMPNTVWVLIGFAMLRFVDCFIVLNSIMLSSIILSVILPLLPLSWSNFFQLSLFKIFTRWHSTYWYTAQERHKNYIRITYFSIMMLNTVWVLMCFTMMSFVDQFIVLSTIMLSIVILSFILPQSPLNWNNFFFLSNISLKDIFFLPGSTQHNDMPHKKCLRTI